MSPRVFAEGQWGALVASEGMIYFLSACCRASATGTTFGTACRGCYQPLPSIYGSCVMHDEHDADVVLLAMLEELTGQRWDLGFAHGVIGRVGSSMRHPSRNGGRLPE